MQAGKLLDAAGYTVKNGVRVDAKGEPLKIEILTFEPTFERLTAPYVKNLKLLGIDARIRMVDPAQYQQRLKGFDFDITTQRYVMRNTPGVELRSYFGSAAAKMDGSLNLAGIDDPAVDALIERVISAKSRRGAEHRSPRARPRAQGRPLLGAALVQGLQHGRLLGQILAPRDEATLRPWHSRHVVV